MAKSFELFTFGVNLKNQRANRPRYSICRVEILEDRTLLSAAPFNASDIALDEADDEIFPAMMADCFEAQSPVDELTESLLAYSQELAASPANLPADAPGRYSNSDIMIGNVYVQVVLLESNGQIDDSTEDWSSDRITVVKNKIIEGLQWWEDTFDKYYPNSPIDLDFQIDFTYADTPFQTKYEPIIHSSKEDYLWVSEFLVSQGYSGGSSRSAVNSTLGLYNYDMRLAHNCDWGYTIFVADSLVDTDGKFSNDYFGYAWIGGPSVQMTYDNNGWGINSMGTVLAHETGHIFCALDEYDVGSSYASGSSSWQETSGYYGIQNLNAWDSPAGQTDSLMAGYYLQKAAWNNHMSSESSLQMIGWRDTDGDGLIDYLDQPLTMTNINGSWNQETGIFQFTGNSAVTCMKNQRTRYDHTLNTVDVLRYKIDDGEWQTAQTWSNTSRVNLNAAINIGSIAGTHTITFQTLCTRTGVTSEEVSFSFGTTALETPTLAVSANGPDSVTVTVGNVAHASGYKLQYSTSEDFSKAKSQNVTPGTTTIRGLSADTTYYFRVMAIGSGLYSSSEFSLTQSVKTAESNGTEITINGKKVTVTWVDENLAADSIRYREIGTTKWKTQKLKAGVTQYSFNGALGASYEIEVLLDQQETNVRQGVAVVLDQAKLKADKNAVRDDSFQVAVTNYTAKNLASNAWQAVLTVNGVQSVLDLADQQGAGALVNGGNVTFNNGLFTFTGMASNTQHKVQISFADGQSVSTPSSALSVKTLKKSYEAPVFVSATPINESTIVLEWETAYGKDSDTPAQMYTVQYSIDDGRHWSNATTKATGNSFTMQKVKEGKIYLFRILATRDSAFEASETSNVLKALTLNMPTLTLVDYTLKDDSFMIIVPNFGVNGNVLVSAEQVHVKSDKFGIITIDLEKTKGVGAFDNGMTVSCNSRTLTFTNVPCNTQQKIQLSYTRGTCTTSWSKALTVKTPMSVYDRPVITSVQAISSSSVQVEWEKAYGKNSQITAETYMVKYSTDGIKWTTATAKVTGTSYTITKLKPNTEYRIAVYALKDEWFDTSLNSLIKRITTPRN